MFLGSGCSLVENLEVVNLLLLQLALKMKKKILYVSGESASHKLNALTEITDVQNQTVSLRKLSKKY